MSSSTKAGLLFNCDFKHSFLLKPRAGQSAAPQLSTCTVCFESSPPISTTKSIIKARPRVSRLLAHSSLNRGVPVLVGLVSKNVCRVQKSGIEDMSPSSGPLAKADNNLCSNKCIP